MKKFFALFTVIALLAVAGSAFAANPTVTASPSSVTLTEGGRAEIALTAIAGHPNGALGAFSVTGDAAAGATVTGSDGSGTLTLAPTDIGSFTVTVRVTETYQDPGHDKPLYAEGTVNVSVTVNSVHEPEKKGDDKTGELDTYVSDDAVAKIAEKLGGTVKALDSNVTLSDNDSGAVPGKTTDSEGNVCLGLLPNMTGLSDGTYLVKYTFPEGLNVSVEGSLKLSANGKMVSVKVFGMDYDGPIQDFSDMAGKTVYLAFKVDDNTIVDNVSLGDVNAAFDLVNPLLVASKKGGGNNPGKSGGGCDAGFTALALAVLGGFIATRRK